MGVGFIGFVGILGQLLVFGTAAPSELGAGDPAPADAEAAQTDPKAVAAEAFRRAVALGTEAKYGAAAEAFDESDAAFASPNAVYNAAFAYEKAEGLLEATSRYRAYLDRYPEGEWRAEVERALGRLSSQIADLVVEVIGAGGEAYEVWVDGERVESFPLMRRPGAVRVEVRGADGALWEARTLDLYPGSAMSAQIEIDRPSETDPGTPPSEGPDDPAEQAGPDDPSGPIQSAPQSGAKALRGSAIAAGVLTAAGGVGIGVTGWLTLREHERFLFARCAIVCTEDKPYPVEIERRFETYRATTNVLIGVTAGLGIVTTGLAIAAAKSASGKARGAAPTTTKLRNPRVRVLPWGVAF